MTDFLKFAGIAMAAALLSGVMDRRDHALAMALGLAACAMAFFGAVESFRPAARFLEELNELSGLGGEYLQPLIKTVGIGIVTQIACAVCADCGQNALSKASELCGTAAALCTSLPLLRAVLDLIGQVVAQ